MELIAIVLSAMSGALVGASVGIFLMYQRLRPITGAELDVLRGKLRNTEFSLNSATANVENLKKQITERDLVLQQHAAEMQEKQHLLDAATADVEQAAGKDSARRAEDAAELTEARQRIDELTADAVALRVQRAELEARLKDEGTQVVDQANQHLASAEAQLEANQRQILELTEQIALFTMQADELRQRSEQEAQDRSALEQRLNEERQHTQELSAQIAELHGELSQSGVRLQEERQSAAKGMEILAMAQQNLSRLFKAAVEPAISNGNGQVVLVASGPEQAAPVEAPEEMQCAAAN